MPTVTVAQVVSDGVAGAPRSCVGSGMLMGAEERGGAYRHSCAGRQRWCSRCHRRTRSCRSCSHRSPDSCVAALQ